MLNVFFSNNNNYIKSYDIFLGLLSGFLVFREFSTYLILAFVLFNLFFFGKLTLNKEKWISILFISVPLILDLIFFWNNVSCSGWAKSSEKHLTCFLFPLFIIGQIHKIDLIRILKVYSAVFSTLLLLGLARHMILSFESFESYLRGYEVWKMGYQYALSMGLHAPALNMHVSFLVVINLYLFLTIILMNKGKRLSIGRAIMFLISFCLLLIINTRLAFLNSILGIFLIIFLEFSKTSRKNLIRTSAVFFLTITFFVSIFIKVFPYTIEKYTSVTFKHIDKIGKLDEFENPEAEVYNGLVTRLSIWKTALGLANEHFWFGVGGANAKEELANEYIRTNQMFLAKYKFPVHNQYLDFYLRFGFLGLLGVLTFMLHIFWTGVRWKSSLLIFFFLLFSLSNFTDDFLIRLME